MTKRLVLAVDPGKTTGIAVFSYGDADKDPQLLYSSEVQADTFAGEIRYALKLAAEAGVELEIACERFTITAQTAKNSQAPYSLEQIGVLKHIVRESELGSDSGIVFQSPVDAKRLFSNAALKKLGFWHVGGGGHALDAIRHGLLYIAKRGWTPLRLLQ